MIREETIQQAQHFRLDIGRCPATLRGRAVSAIVAAAVVSVVVGRVAVAVAAAGIAVAVVAAGIVVSVPVAYIVVAVVVPGIAVSVPIPSVVVAVVVSVVAAGRAGAAPSAASDIAVRAPRIGLYRSPAIRPWFDRPRSGCGSHGGCRKKGRQAQEQMDFHGIASTTQHRFDQLFR